VVEVPICWAYVFLVMNILCPGAGTWCSAWCCCGKKFRCDTLCHAYGQAILAGIVVGWLWSIMHGIWLVKVATKASMSVIHKAESYKIEVGKPVDGTPNVSSSPHKEVSDFRYP